MISLKFNYVSVSLQAQTAIKQIADDVVYKNDIYKIEDPKHIPSEKLSSIILKGSN